jgi:hypothetical protein
MRDFIQILLLISFTETIAQDVTILDASNAYYLDGTELKNRNALLTDQKVEIKKKGHLGIRYGHWRIYLKQGVYNMDSAIMAQRQIREYIIDDSIYSILKTKELHDCEDTSIQCANPYKYLDPWYKDDRITKASSDTVVLKWENETNMRFYYVVLSNMWDEYIGIHTSDKNELILDLLAYKNERTIFYKVISEDCAASETKQIRIE